MSTVFISIGRATVAGVTIVRTACCDQELSHHDCAADPPSLPEPEAGFRSLSTWHDETGAVVTHCRCGEDLPDPTTFASGEGSK